jgi:hypothetical protein
MSIDKRLISTGVPAVCTADTLDIFEDSSCVALYGLNYDGSDASGNYDGTPTDVTFNAPGYIDYAASFNGTSSKVNTGYIQNGQVFSCSFWGKDFSAYGSILRDTPSGGGTNTRIDISAGGASIPYAVFYGSGSAVYLGTTGSTPVGWHHYVITADGSTAKLYMDGVEEASISYTPVSGNNSTPVHMMSNGAFSAGFGSGKLDQVRIFNKALSSSEVTTLYGEVACEYTCTTDTNGFPASASSNLVAYYKLDNDATDGTGSYDGTASNVTFDGGRYGASAVFNGSSSKINSTAGLSGNPVFSISFWINPTSTGTPIMFGNNSNGQAFLTFINSSYKLNFGRWGDSLGDSTASVPQNTWTHIAIANNAGNVQLYINGVADLSFSTTYSIANTNFYIGAASTTQYFDGQLDQVRIYDKALSSTEVSSLYEDEHQCYITVDSTDPFGDSSNIALYKFENNANDSIGGYNGTVSGTVSYSTDSVVGAYSVEFSSGHINTGHSFNLANNSFSFSFWVANSATGSTNSYFISTDDPAVYPDSENKVLIIGRRDSSGKLAFAFYLNDLDSATLMTTDGTWQHWVCTYDASTNARKIYLNGSLDASDTASADFQGTGNVEFGYGIYQAYGKLDQVRIFNRVLNGDEIWKLYAEGAKG